MRKKYTVIFLISTLIFALAACSNSNRNTENDSGNNIVNDKVEDNTKEIVLYFVNAEYVKTGDESLEHLIPKKRIIEYEDMSLEEAIVRELMQDPGDEELSTEIPKTVELLGVEVSDGVAYVDFAKEGLFGGSMQESFTISQIVNSLTELDNIDKVQFLVEGEKTEEPFERIED